MPVSALSVFHLIARNTCLRLQDEIDSLAASRGQNYSNGGVSDGILTSLLNEMDGIEELGNVIIVAATNRPEILVSR